MTIDDHDHDHHHDHHDDDRDDLSTHAEPAGRVAVAGTISSAAFETGDRFVIGNWPTSPIGPMCDVMWATPDDRRILLAPEQPIADFITRIYDFDEVRVDPFCVDAGPRHTQVASNELQLRLVGGWPLPLLPSWRPLRFTELVEAPIARRLLGVETCGVSPTGAREWYQATSVRWVTSADATLHHIAPGHADRRRTDLGSPHRITRPLGVGFSEPPTRPSIVSVHVTIDLPDTSRRADSGGGT